MRYEHSYFMTSRSDGSSAEMSLTNFEMCLEDINGKGAVLSSPRMDCISWRIFSVGSLGSVCSLRRAGMLF